MGILNDRLKELYSDSDYSDEYLEHEGRDHNSASGNYTSRPIPGSGRHMYGTGERELQHDFSLRARYKKMRADHPEFSESQLAAALGYYTYDKNGNPILNPDGTYKGNINKLRANVSIERNREYYEQRVKVYDLLNTIDPETGKLYTNSKVAEIVFGDKSKESKIRYMLSHEEASENALQTLKVSNELMERVGDSNYIDIGSGAELALGCSQTRLNVAIEMLKEQGYTTQEIYIRQMGKTDGSATTIKVLCPPGAEPGDAWKNRFLIKGVEDIEPGETTASLLGIEDPVRVDLSRVKVLYGDEGGTLKDGMIEVRAKYDDQGNLVAACPDLDLGNAKYAQVRIAIDAAAEGLGDRYIKGMAVYNPDLDCDILVNSNKSNLDKALKEMKTVKLQDGTEVIDVNNPFGATVYQTHYKENGENKLSALNIVGDPTGSDIHREGSWGDWSRNNPSQFLAKQSEALVDNQLKLKELEMKAEYEKILSLNNPVVKKQMLLDFADSCDGAAVDLKGAPLPGQTTKVILAATTLKDNEVFCPGLPNGTTVALVRYPHTGPFEIPILKVNNNNKECQVFMKDAKDAIAINHLNAMRLSGADHDGDTASVIPMTKLVSDGQGGKVFDTTVNIKGIGNGALELPGMKNFETTQWEKVDSQGKKIPGFKYMTEAQKGTQMGIVSNLITDMSNQGCDDPKKLERAVKYSMVVIDAVKHNLDWKAAEKYYDIESLKKEYQAHPDGSYGGASSLMSRASAEKDVAQRKMWNPGKNTIDSDTGEKIYTETERTKTVREPVKVPAPAGYTWTDSNGKPHKSKWLKDKDGKDVYETDKNGNVKWQNTEKTVKVTQKSTRMAEARSDAAVDALMSDKPSVKEIRYANFAKTMKAMANTARKEYLTIPHQDVDPQAKKKYANEVASLEKQLLNAKKNAPRERLAQLMATQIYNEMYANNPKMDADEKSRKRSQALYGARKRTGAEKVKVKFTEKEWEAINARAISESKLTDLLKNAKKESYTKLALPKESRISPATAKYINALLDAGWSREQIMDSGYSIDTINKVASGSIQ